MKIVLADDHRIMREGLRRCLGEQPDCQVIGEAENGAQAVELVRQLSPDMVIMDIAMPVTNGIDATRHIRALRRDPVRVIILSMHAESEFVTEALRAGASAYLLKSSAFDELHRAMQVVAQGHTYVSPAVAGTLVEAAVGQRGSVLDNEIAQLSPREREVLRYMAEGENAKLIGMRLGVSHKTVHTFRSRLMQKLRVTSEAELTKLAIRAGLTSLAPAPRLRHQDLPVPKS